MVTIDRERLGTDLRTPDERLRDAVLLLRNREESGTSTGDLIRTDFIDKRPSVQRLLPHQYGFALVTDSRSVRFEIHAVPILRGVDFSDELAREIDDNLSSDGSKIVDILRRGVFVFQAGDTIRETVVEKIQRPAWEPLFTVVKTGFPNHQLIPQI